MTTTKSKRIVDRKRLNDYDAILIKIDKLISNAKVSMKYAQSINNFADCIVFISRINTLKEVRTVIAFMQYEKNQDKIIPVSPQIVIGTSNEVLSVTTNKY